jgi:hypothetical protein
VSQDYDAIVAAREERRREVERAAGWHMEVGSKPGRAKGAHGKNKNRGKTGTSMSRGRRRRR